MRMLGLVLLAIGVIGLILGILTAIGLSPIDRTEAYATWRGVGPMLAGLMLLGVGTYFALRRA